MVLYILKCTFALVCCAAINVDINIVVSFIVINSNKISQVPATYEPNRSCILFEGNKTKYYLWEVKFLAYIQFQKLYDIILLIQGYPEIEN